jgi:hypothetical protein
MRKRILFPMLAVVLAVAVSMTPVAANGAVTVDYGDVTLEGGFEAGHFGDMWDLTAGDIVLSFTYDATGLVDDSGAHAWAELGVRSVTWASETVDLIAGQHMDVGDIVVQRFGDDLCVEYQLSAEALAEGWFLTETHLAVAGDPADLPQTKKGDPIPGRFPYGDDALGVYDEEGNLIGGVDSYSECISLADLRLETEDEIHIAAHAVVGISCHETVVYGITRFEAEVYGVDVLTGTSWMVFDAAAVGGSATPNGLAYDAENGRFYYCDYYAPNTLYFWDTSQHVAGTLLGNVADAGFYDGKYYYITGPPASDDLYEVTFNADGTINAQTKLDDIADGVHGWTFNGDIAVKGGVVYGWGLCGPNSKYEFFTYGLDTGDFASVTPSYQSSLQLAFGSDGTLYGHRSGGAGAFYVVDTTNGDVSMVTPTPDPARLYTDCASGEICVPITETAWGAGIDFPGANWATYFAYAQASSDFNPTWMEGGSGVWLATDYDWTAGTFDPDPEGSPTLDIDDKLILQRGGGMDESYYNLPSTPPNPWANHAVWFDRDGVDQWQALMWGAIDGVTYNTGGTYDVVITLHANNDTAGTAYMTVNGEPQGFYDPGWHPGPADLMPAGMTFTGDMQQLQVFYGLYGYGAIHTVLFTDITVTQ